MTIICMIRLDSIDMMPPLSYTCTGMGLTVVNEISLPMRTSYVTVEASDVFIASCASLEVLPHVGKMGFH